MFDEPEYTRPTATSPACGSIHIFVIINDSGPSASHSIIALPSESPNRPAKCLEFGISGTPLEKAEFQLPCPIELDGLGLSWLDPSGHQRHNVRIYP